MSIGMTKTVSAYHGLLVQAVATLVGRDVTQAEIRAAYSAAHPNRADDLQWIMASDHCANHTNRGACGCAMTDGAVFDRLGRNRYRVRPVAVVQIHSR